MDYPATTSSNNFNNFIPKNKYLDDTYDFFISDSIFSKLAFLLLVIFFFMIALKIGTKILEYFLSPSNSPKLITGMVDAKHLIVFPQDPSTSGAVTITRSKNEVDGIEFTWSVWIFIDDLQYNAGKYRSVFYKGNEFSNNPDSDVQGLNFPNNAPGLYIAPHTNDLVVMMNTFNVINEEITVKDIPLNKWVNVIIRCENNTMDVYINGSIVKSHHLRGVPKQNYGDVYVGMDGGFSGNISNLWYYNHALGVSEIQRLVDNGPNTTMSKNTTSAIASKDTDYLSLRWIFGNI